MSEDGDKCKRRWMWIWVWMKEISVVKEMGVNEGGNVGERDKYGRRRWVQGDLWVLMKKMNVRKFK